MVSVSVDEFSPWTLCGYYWDTESPVLRLSVDVEIDQQAWRSRRQERRGPRISCGTRVDGGPETYEKGRRNEPIETEVEPQSQL